MVAIGTARAATPVTPLLLPEANAAERDFRELTWAELADVDFKDVYLEELDSYYWKPVFGPQVFAAEGEDVYITGYVIPVDLDEDFYVLSRYPFANCFFCGGAGPESVVDLRFSDVDHRTYQTDERLTFHGNLRLNADDVYQMNYILEVELWRHSRLWLVWVLLLVLLPVDSWSNSMDRGLPFCW